MVCECKDPKCRCGESCSCVAALCLCAQCMKIRLELHDSSSKEAHTPAQPELSEGNQNICKPGPSNSTEATEKQLSEIKTREETLRDAPSQSTSTISNEKQDCTFSQNVLQMIYQQGLQYRRIKNVMPEVPHIPRSRSNSSSCEDSLDKKDLSSMQAGPSTIRKRSQSQISSSEKGSICPAKKYKLQSSETEPECTAVRPSFSAPVPSSSSSLPSAFLPIAPSPSTSKSSFSQEEISGESCSDSVVETENDVDSSSDFSQDDPFCPDEVNIYGDKRNSVTASSSINAPNNPFDSMEGAFPAIEKLQKLASTVNQKEVEGLALSILEKFLVLQQSSTRNQMDNSTNSDETKQSQSTSPENEKPS